MAINLDLPDFPVTNIVSLHFINNAFGRNITASHQGTDEEADQTVSIKRSCHVIAAMYFKSGKTGVKVLPRTVKKILNYYSAATAHPDVDEVNLYLHAIPFFNRHPTSAAFRILDIDKLLLETNLKKARKLKINDSQTIKKRQPHPYQPFTADYEVIIMRGREDRWVSRLFIGGSRFRGA